MFDAGRTRDERDADKAARSKAVRTAGKPAVPPFRMIYREAHDA